MSNKQLEVQHEQPDSWHRHAMGEGHAQHEHVAHVNAKALAITFIAMVLGTVFVIITLLAFFNSYTSRLKEQVQETTKLGEGAREAKAQSLGELESYGWVNHETVRIPIGRAMEEVVQQRNSGGQG